MPPPYCYDYPRPAVTVDLAVFRRDRKGLRVLMIRRKHDPFAGSWALPGGFVEIEEAFEDAARRELLEETGFAAKGPIGFVGVFGDPGRDPRGRTISMVYATAVAKAKKKVAGGDDASEADWLDPRSLQGLAFDHDKVLARALEWLQSTVLANQYADVLLPADFNPADVRGLFADLMLPLAKIRPWLAREIKLRGLVETDGRYARPKSR